MTISKKKYAGVSLVNNDCRQKGINTQMQDEIPSVGVKPSHEADMLSLSIIQKYLPSGSI